MGNYDKKEVFSICIISQTENYVNQHNYIQGFESKLLVNDRQQKQIFSKKYKNSNENS